MEAYLEEVEKCASRLSDAPLECKGLSSLMKLDVRMCKEIRSEIGILRDLQKVFPGGGYKFSGGGENTKWKLSSNQPLKRPF